MFRAYVLGRADVVNFSTPIGGAEMVCDCDLGDKCHGFELISLYNQVCTEPEAQHVEKKVDAMSVATVMEGFDEDDEDDLFFRAADEDVLPAPKFNAKIEAVNETIRSGAAANIHDERPDWLPSWVCLLYTSPSPRDRTRSRMPSSA